MSSPVTKAVIPAAGLGTRLLPITKAVPKELLPILNIPVIQFAVEEAVASGIRRVILVLRAEKHLVADYFAREDGLERILARRDGEHEKGEAASLRSLSELAEIQIAWQEKPIGLADAIRSAQPLIGEEPFAVLLPDVLVDSAMPCIAQLIACYEKHPGCIVAARGVDSSEVDRFGMLEIERITDACCAGRTLRVRSLTERPPRGSTHLKYGIFGRYILEPQIFAAMRGMPLGRTAEFQLTDALARHCRQAPIYAHCFEGSHYDVGSAKGYLQATLAYALKDPDLAQIVQEAWATFGNERSPAVPLSMVAHNRL